MTAAPQREFRKATIAGVETKGRSRETEAWTTRCPRSNPRGVERVLVLGFEMEEGTVAMSWIVRHAIEEPMIAVGKAWVTRRRQRREPAPAIAVVPLAPFRRVPGP